MQQNLLTLTAGTRSDVPDGNEVVWHRRERRQGAFARAVQLPFRVDAEKVQAHSRDGLIEIELHRPEEDRPRKIPVSRPVELRRQRWNSNWRRFGPVRLSLRGER